MVQHIKKNKTLQTSILIWLSSAAFLYKYKYLTNEAEFDCYNKSSNEIKNEHFVASETYEFTFQTQQRTVTVFIISIASDFSSLKRSKVGMHAVL
jgi:hypothetical protein